MKKNSVIFLIIVILLAGATGVYFWLKSSQATILIDQASISAPEIDLTAPQGGFLKEVYVSEGDMVETNTVIARVNNALVKTSSAGEVITLRGGIGRVVSAGETIAILIDPNSLHVVGQMPENKGLASISVGQQAYFTVDAYGTQKFYGTVSEISPTANTGNVAFQTSGTRSTQNFEVKIDFDPTSYPQFKNGMSARIWIVK